MHHLLNFHVHLQHLLNLHLHLPIITVILSTSREATLQRAGKTDFETSWKNISLDVLSITGGWAIGEWAERMIGHALHHPHPGVKLGAMAGSYIARYIANEFKRKPLKQAIEQAEAAEEKWKRDELTAAHKVEIQVNATLEEKKRLLLQLDPIPQLGDGVEQLIFPDTMNLHLKASSYVNSVRACVNRANRYARGWYHGLLVLLVPEISQLAGPLFLVESRVTYAEQLLPDNDLVQTKPVDALERLSRMAIPLEGYNKFLYFSIQRVQAVLPPFNRRVAEWYVKASKLCEQAEKEVAKVIETSLLEYKETCGILLEGVLEAHENVQKEADKLGIKRKES